MRCADTDILIDIFLKDGSLKFRIKGPNDLLTTHWNLRKSGVKLVDVLF